MEDSYNVLGEDTIQFIHYADGDPSGHFILGDGNLPLKEYLNILEKHNYTGIVDLEINDSIYWTFLILLYSGLSTISKKIC